MTIYRIFPDTARNFEDDIMRDLRRGSDVLLEWREPVRFGPLMVAPELAERTRRYFLGSVSRPNPARRARKRRYGA